MDSISRSNLQVIYGRKLRRVTAQRVLCSVLVYYPEEVSLNMLLVLFDNILWLQDKSQKDPDFAKKFGLYLKVQAYILQHHRSPDATSPASIKRLSNSFLNNISGFLLDKRHTLPELRKVMAQIEIRPGRSLGVEKRKLPTPRFIGVGYKDKGSARKPHLDGTPSWQEIARQPEANLK